MKVFALPFAGASATGYYRFNRFFNKHITICPGELPGRGTKSGEELEHSIDGMIDSIYGEILNEISDGEPYAIYGHSMGSLLAYELAYRLCEDEGVDNRPLKLLVSGRIAPQVKTKNEKNYLLSTEEFKEKILSYSLVSSEEVFKDQKLLDFFIPIMRADFEAVEEYSYLEHKKLNIDIAAFWGMDDYSVKYEDVVKWKEMTNGMFSLMIWIDLLEKWKTKWISFSILVKQNATSLMCTDSGLLYLVRSLFECKKKWVRSVKLYEESGRTSLNV